MTPRFDLRDAIGQGRTVIEASAGTGKTYTIAAIVNYLVARDEIPIDRILVVTFTRAATAELRGRVRQRLVDTIKDIDAIRTGHGDDRHETAVLLEGQHPDQVRTRVMNALGDFDRAQIFTIDAFARRLLGELGFGSRLSPELEPMEIDGRLVSEAAADLVIGRFATTPDQRLRPDVKLLTRIGSGVMGVPDATIVPDVASVTGRARVRVEFARDLRLELARRLRREGLVTFEDGLAEIVAALGDPGIGGSVRELLAKRYAIGLVDEAQDTDPVQWQVVRAVFEGTRLVVIGDPKQSIYSFRGADLASYLAAGEGANKPPPLDRNWRSDGPLLAGLDLLFKDATFGDDRIVYQPVAPPEEHAGWRIGGVDGALSIRYVTGDIGLSRRKDGRFYVGDIRKWVAADTASAIVDLLESAVTIDGGPLRPSDLAVLCRTAKQVETIRQELGRRRVPSVAGRSGAVFTSPPAEEWRRFLMGAEHPERMDRVRLAATSHIMGMSLAEVAALDDEVQLDLQTRMRDLGRILRDEGVPAVLAEVDRSTGLTRRMLARPDGERFMTDLTHVAEELHAAWRPGRIGSLVGWLESVMADSIKREDSRGEEPESRQRRLETDAEAVQVLTVHGAKGLEFPVVLVPYAWDQPDFVPEIPVFHDPSDPTRRLIDVAGEREHDDAPEVESEFGRHQRLARAEDVAEESRLLYVALTRARHHLVIWWIKDAPGASDSWLGRLLTRDGWKEDARAAPAGVLSKVARSGTPSLLHYQSNGSDRPLLEVARFDRRLDQLWRRASFSTLAPEHLAPDENEEQVEAHLDDIAPDDEAEVAEGPGFVMADLPRGARFGTLVHEIFESVVFADQDLEGTIRGVIAEKMRGSDWDFDVKALVNGMVGAMTTPLGPDSTDPTLAGVGRVLKELVFELPVRTAEGAVSLTDIGVVMSEHLTSDDPFRRYASYLELVGEERFRGFLTGAIDLTLVRPDGRWVVMDYKSNALTDYGEKGLAQAMIDGNYVLQSTLYQVALHRYLRWRLSGYDPTSHLGGSIYLFVRGTGGPDTPVIDGVRSGVHLWTPPTSMITALSDLFEGGSR